MEYHNVSKLLLIRLSGLRFTPYASNWWQRRKSWCGLWVILNIVIITSFFRLVHFFDVFGIGVSPFLHLFFGIQSILSFVFSLLILSFDISQQFWPERSVTFSSASVRSTVVGWHWFVMDNLFVNRRLATSKTTKPLFLLIEDLMVLLLAVLNGFLQRIIICLHKRRLDILHTQRLPVQF